MSEPKPKRPMPFNDFVESALQAMGPKMPTLPELPDPATFLPDERATGTRKGLFQQLLAGEAGVLYFDSRERPELYSQDTMQVLSDLVSGARTYGTLTDDERRLLDIAATVYATTPVKPQEQVRDQKRILRNVARKLAPMPPRPSAEPEHNLPPYWWLREDDGRKQNR
jgi:hypothetical protein